MSISQIRWDFPVKFYKPVVIILNKQVNKAMRSNFYLWTILQLFDVHISCNKVIFWNIKLHPTFYILMRYNTMFLSIKITNMYFVWIILRLAFENCYLLFWRGGPTRCEKFKLPTWYLIILLKIKYEAYLKNNGRLVVYRVFPRTLSIFLEFLFELYR